MQKFELALPTTAAEHHRFECAERVLLYD